MKNEGANGTVQTPRCPRNINDRDPLCGGPLAAVTASSASSPMGLLMAAVQAETTYECQTCGAAWPASNFNLRWHNGLLSDDDAIVHMEPLGGIGMMRERQFVNPAEA